MALCTPQLAWFYSAAWPDLSPPLTNSRRPHSSLDGKTPDQAYFN
tara:strand:+ start:1165 stop:1299 length:135 start_codon:yes stop_codon:yes gene_type:complete